MFDITEIISAVITIITACITVLLIPYLKTKLDEAKRKRIKEYVDVAVLAAEQLFPSLDGEKMGKDKLNYVAKMLEAKGITFNVDDINDSVRAMIESAVREFTN